jgi:hypothetical protein
MRRNWHTRDGTVGREDAGVQTNVFSAWIDCGLAAQLISDHSPHRWRRIMNDSYTYVVRLLLPNHGLRKGLLSTDADQQGCISETPLSRMKVWSCGQHSAPRQRPVGKESDDRKDLQGSRSLQAQLVGCGGEYRSNPLLP